MHNTAAATGKAFFEFYARPQDSVLEIGSLNINGTLRDGARGLASYHGVDMVAGLDVDQVLSDSHVLPFADDSYDLVVSSSSIEHDPMFWVTFGEMVRVARKFIYLSAPVQGPVHNHPLDCWRFYPDAGIGLAQWGRKLGFDINLAESFLHPPVGDIWWDFVAVFVKNSSPLPEGTLSRRFGAVAKENRQEAVTAPKDPVSVFPLAEASSGTTDENVLG